MLLRWNWDCQRMHLCLKRLNEADLVVRCEIAGFPDFVETLPRGL